MALGGFCCCKHLKPRFQEEKERLGKVGRLMKNNDPADRGGQRNVLEHVAQVNEDLDSLENALRQLIRDRHSSIGPADISNAPGIMLICEVIKIIRQKAKVNLRDGKAGY